MQNCLNHPDVPTARHCEVCLQPFCHGCLEEYEPVGPVCAECETVLEEEPPETLLERLPAFREEVRRSLPPEPRWWGWEVFFWGAVAVPGLVAFFYLSQLFQHHQYMAVLSQEPLLPGQTVVRLTEVGAALERHFQKHGAYPESLEALKAPELADPTLVRDLYNSDERPLLYSLEEGQYRLCSQGPDRMDNNGATLDRFSGAGDLCLGS